MGTGTVSFQANDMMDVFYVARVEEEGIETSDEALVKVDDPQFDSDKAWVTGNIPKIKPVNVDGDTSIINAWFKGETFDVPFVITIYVECETVEELEVVVADEKKEEEQRGEIDPLEPMEIHL
ncbi:MAG TPA: hypothetical protein PK325_00815 [Cyclobacteriaceae bacterium]|nr:hypothetical protein [Cyclobacteriaceae bacterium]HMX87996.1 hypothetical protein [Saprospiraceae bacterium]HMV08190.1 hypothetical protein [Cyclobacteriaceae bacterium]HMX00831.1 hypothetical protein [Cyclobacteriaceae bacterium]HMY93634.1 hypothetical protein [Cyclobacteriaceae bacterium]